MLGDDFFLIRGRVCASGGTDTERDEKLFLRWALRADTSIAGGSEGWFPPTGLGPVLFHLCLLDGAFPFAARAQQSLFPFEVLRELQEVKKPAVGARISSRGSLFGVSGNTSRGMQSRAGCGVPVGRTPVSWAALGVLYGLLAGSWPREWLLGICPSH